MLGKLQTGHLKEKFMRINKKIILHLITSLFICSAHADESLLRIDNSNAKIHSMNIKADMIKAEIALQNLEDSRQASIDEKKIKAFISNNNHKIQEMNSAFMFLLQSTISDVKNGRTSTDDIENTFLREKVVASIQADRSETEILLAKIEKLNKTIIGNKDYIRDLNMQIFDIKAQGEESMKPIIEDLNVVREQLNIALNTIKALESCNTDDVKCDDGPVEASNILTIHSAQIISSMIFKDLKKIILSFNYSTSDNPNEMLSLNNIIILNSKDVLIPNYGSISLHVNETNTIIFKHNDVILYSHPVL